MISIVMGMLVLGVCVAIVWVSGWLDGREAAAQKRRILALRCVGWTPWHSYTKDPRVRRIQPNYYTVLFGWGWRDDLWFRPGRGAR